MNLWKLRAQKNEYDSKIN
jgi:hypothetical protein